MKEFYITDDGIQLHAKLDMPEEKEKCPLVIVFHGLTGNMEERHITAVSNAMNEIGFATLRVELYGHGKSGGAFEQHNLMKWINNAMTVTDYAKTLDFVTDLYICGHSQGGLLTMLAAGMRADDFKAAIPMSPAIVIPDGARKGNLTFFQNYSLNRGFHSLYGVKEDFRNLQQNKVFIPYMKWKLRKSKLF